MKNILTFEDFLNESIKKSEFAKLDDVSQANAIINDNSILSYISGDKLAGIIEGLRDKETLKKLVDSLNLADLKLYPLMKIANNLPEYGENVINAISKGNIKERIDVHAFIAFYRAVSRIQKMRPLLPLLTKTAPVELVISCPTLIELFDPKACAKSASNDLGTSLLFITLPDEFVTIKQKQEFVNNLSKKLVDELDNYSNGDYRSIRIFGEYGVNQAFSNQYMVGSEESKFVGKYNKNIKMASDEGVDFFNGWFNQIKK
jgi:hypothetical protein